MALCTDGAGENERYEGYAREIKWAWGQTIWFCIIYMSYKTTIAVNFMASADRARGLNLSYLDPDIVPHSVR